MDEPSTAGRHTGGVAGPYASMVGSGASLRRPRRGSSWRRRADLIRGCACRIRPHRADGPDVNHPSGRDRHLLVLLIGIGSNWHLSRLWRSRRRLTRQPSGACSGRCWSRRPPLALVLIVLGELLRVLLHLTVGSPSIAGGVILLFQAVWMCSLHPVAETISPQPRRPGRGPSANEPDPTPSARPRIPDTPTRPIASVPRPRRCRSLPSASRLRAQPHGPPARFRPKTTAGGPWPTRPEDRYGGGADEPGQHDSPATCRSAPQRRQPSPRPHPEWRSTCTPVASTSRVRVWDRKFRSASTIIPDLSAVSRSFARVCFPTVYGTKLARSAPPVPDSAAAGRRTWGNARPESHWTGARSTGCSRPCPGHRWWNRPSTPPQPAAEHPRPPDRRPNRRPSLPPPPTGPATASNSMCSGSDPNLALARAGLEMWTAAPPPLPGIHPAGRIQQPVQQLHPRCQPRRPLAHHPAVAAVTAAEQPQRQHEVHHQPGQ